MHRIDWAVLAAEARDVLDRDEFVPDEVTRRNRLGVFVRDVNGAVGGVVFIRRSRRRVRLILALLRRCDGESDDARFRPLDADRVCCTFG